MRSCVLGCVLVLAAWAGGCASSGEPAAKSDENLDFFERLAKREEERKAGRRDALAERRKAREEGRPAAPSDGRLEYYRGTDDPGPRAAIRVTWEGLAREREIAAASENKRPPGTVAPPMMITLVSESHPDAVALRSDASRLRTVSEEGAAMAVVRDRDLLDFVQGLEKGGFFDVAQDTNAQSSMFGNTRARGRVTVERDGRSMTILSMRGQGLDPRTKRIPALYSESKQAIMVMRNRTSALSFTGFETDAVLPGY